MPRSATTAGFGVRCPCFWPPSPNRRPAVRPECCLPRAIPVLRSAPARPGAVRPPPPPSAPAHSRCQRRWPPPRPRRPGRRCGAQTRWCAPHRPSCGRCHAGLPGCFQGTAGPAPSPRRPPRRRTSGPPAAGRTGCCSGKKPRFANADLRPAGHLACFLPLFRCNHS